MAIVIHKNIPEAQLHAPKGFNLPATNSMSYALRSETDTAIYQDVEYLPAAINFVDGNNPPPTSVLNDIYVIIDGGGGVVDAGWNGVAFNSWSRFDSVQWNEVAPVDGYQCYDKTLKEYKTFNGTNWVSAGGGESNTASNVGAGSGVFKQKTGVDLEFKSLTAGTGIGLNVGADSIEIENTLIAANIYTADGTQTGARTVDQNNFNLAFINSTIGIGTGSPAAASRLHIVGKGSTSATTGLLVQNILGINSLQVLDDLSVFNLGGGSVSTNTAFGGQALRDNTSGSNNTAIGKIALRVNSTGLKNTAVGSSAMQNNLTGSNNTAIGADSLFNGTASIGNTAIGRAALAVTTGNFNTSIGNASLTINTSGTENVGLGHRAGEKIITGSSNTFLGSYSGLRSTGSFNVFLGANSGSRETGNRKFMVDYLDRASEAVSRDESLIYSEMNSAPENQRLTVNAFSKLHNFTVAEISASTLTVSNGDMVYVSDTDATFTSVGFWGYENGAWIKL